MIVRALGMKESVQVDILTEIPRVGDTFMLCSDGLTGMLKDDQIQHILLTERDLDRAVSRLINAANEPQNWLLMNGDYGATRSSKLTQINRDNVKRLQPAWMLQN